jgi:hypothetical protein
MEHQHKMNTFQLIVQVSTWIFLYLLHSRTLRRSEISRLKEQIVTSLSTYPAWIEKILQKELVTISDVENYVAAANARLDFLSTNLNRHAKCEILPAECISKLTGVAIKDSHIASIKGIKEIERTTFDITSDLIEKIEIKYTEKMYTDNALKMLFNEYTPELKGAICMLLILHMSFSMIHIIIS